MLILVSLNFQPTRLISPDTLLRKRRGNSYEMATLLASMLIGAGHAAVVVSGVAREETVLNDLHNEVYPYDIEDVEDELQPQKKKVESDAKYKLRPLPDLESHLEQDMAEVHRERALAQRLRDIETLKRQMFVRISYI